MATAPRPSPAEPSATHLRLVQDEEQPAGVNLGAWTLLFGALSASAGHGLFLVAALTRLSSLPSRAELGGWFESAVLAWFAACLPLALLAGLARARFLALAPAPARALALATATLTVLAFVAYLRAIAL